MGSKLVFQKFKKMQWKVEIAVMILNTWNMDPDLENTWIGTWIFRVHHLSPLNKINPLNNGHVHFCIGPEIYSLPLLKRPSFIIAFNLIS